VYRLFGWAPSDLMHQPVFDFIHPDDVAAARARFQETLRRPGAPVTAEARLRHADGTYRIVEAVGVNRLHEPAVRAFVVNGRDVTDRRVLEDQLRQVQKMEAVGRLAGGIAHDFNNLLTAILGFADLLLATFPPNDPRRADMREIERAAQSAAGLTRQLLAFSRKQVLQPVVFDLNTHISSMSGLLRRLVGERIEVRTAFEAAALPISADPTQIEQVLLNLAINARDAMPGGGRLDFVTGRCTVTEPATREGIEIAPGTYARLVVSDTGHGMSAQTLVHIFEPFFTTKSRGNGMGLATVYGIVKQSGGYIWVSSQVGAGTSFEVLLPETAAEMHSGATDRRAPAAAPLAAARVLVVDDDRAIRALVVRTLEREGFTVVQAADASQALALAADVSLLLSDVALADATGPELARAVAAVRPHVKFLFMSGYASDALSEPLPGGEAGDVMEKPFTPDVLLLRVRQAIERP
jgi:PAS domain S-box-containing protein